MASDTGSSWAERTPVLVRAARLTTLDRTRTPACCRVLEVSTSAYYSWQRRPLADHHVQDELLKQRIRELHQASKGRYGAPRLQADLRAEGQRVSRKRISRLMRRRGLWAKGPRRFVRTTDSDHLLAVCPNLLNREFDVRDANTVWASDLTFIPTKEGWLYLAVTLDLHSRAVVGQRVDSQMPTTLPLAALQMAVSVRTPPSGLLHHSDCGSGQACSSASVLPKKPIRQ